MPKKVVTWNLQGGTGDKASKIRSFMNDADCFAICLQECGNLFNWGGTGSAITGAAGWYVAYLENWTASNDGNNRCSLAILARSAPAAADRFRWTTDNARQRPVIGAKVGGQWVFSIHAPAGGNAAYVTNALTAAKGKAGATAWLMAGDYNIAAASAVQQAGCVLCRPNVATQISGGELDYAYGKTAWTTAAGSVGFSDHAWVTFTQ